MWVVDVKNVIAYICNWIHINGKSDVIRPIGRKRLWISVLFDQQELNDFKNILDIVI